MSDNLAIWNTLGKTDPKHTKPFNRAGGFKGTAIKPIYTEQKMTEQFGPCGIGWGIDEPKFETAPGSDGQLAVYCWVSIWVNVDGKVSAPIYGVGGDMVVVKQSAGLRTDDEAFKKAFTDAVGNAMKHLGMSADVHLGRFDDSKYVSERAAEEAGAKPVPSQTPPAKPPTGPGVSASTFAARIDAANTINALETIRGDLQNTDESVLTQQQFDALWADIDHKVKSMTKPSGKNPKASLDALDQALGGPAN